MDRRALKRKEERQVDVNLASELMAGYFSETFRQLKK